MSFSAIWAFLMPSVTGSVYFHNAKPEPADQPASSNTNCSLFVLNSTKTSVDTEWKEIASKENVSRHTIHSCTLNILYRVNTIAIFK